MAIHYTYHKWPDGETCRRCSAEIHSGWIIDSKKYGPTCGKKVLRQMGITWPAKYGPGSFDPSAMAHAVELNRSEHGRWVYPYEMRKAHKEIVGIIGWTIAQALAKDNKALRLNSDDAVRCYNTAIKGMEND